MRPVVVDFPCLGDTWRLTLNTSKYLDRRWRQAENHDPAINHVVGLTVADELRVYIWAGLTPWACANTICHEMYHVVESPQYADKPEELKALCLGDACAFVLGRLGLGPALEESPSCAPAA